MNVKRIENAIIFETCIGDLKVIKEENPYGNPDIKNVYEFKRYIPDYQTYYSLMMTDEDDSTVSVVCKTGEWPAFISGTFEVSENLIMFLMRSDGDPLAVFAQDINRNSACMVLDPDNLIANIVMTGTSFYRRDVFDVNYKIGIYPGIDFDTFEEFTETYFKNSEIVVIKNILDPDGAEYVFTIKKGDWHFTLESGGNIAKYGISTPIFRLMLLLTSPIETIIENKNANVFANLETGNIITLGCDGVHWHIDHPHAPSMFVRRLADFNYAVERIAEETELQISKVNMAYEIEKLLDNAEIENPNIGLIHGSYFVALFDYNTGETLLSSDDLLFEPGQGSYELVQKKNIREYVGKIVVFGYHGDSLYLIRDLETGDVLDSMHIADSGEVLLALDNDLDKMEDTLDEEIFTICLVDGMVMYYSESSNILWPAKYGLDSEEGITFLDSDDFDALSEYIGNLPPRTSILDNTLYVRDGSGCRMEVWCDDSCAHINHNMSLSLYKPGVMELQCTTCNLIIGHYVDITKLEVIDDELKGEQ